MDDKPKSRAELRLEEEYARVEGSRDAQRFEEQGGMTPAERKEAESILSSIQKERAKRGDYEAPEAPSAPEAKPQDPEEKAPVAEANQESSEELTDEELAENREELESEEECEMDDDGYSDEELEELTQGL